MLAIRGDIMKRSKNLQLPNYVRKLHYLYRIGAIPADAGLHMVDIEHDDWCGIFQGKRCNCDPTIKLKASVPDVSRN
jgi:hypothetical protein